jgi:hypothetical protein
MVLANPVTGARSRIDNSGPGRDYAHAVMQLHECHAGSTARNVYDASQTTQ